MPWATAQREAFVRMQFDAQDARLPQAQPRTARFDVVEVDGRAGRRLYVDRRPDDIRIVDIALLPEFRGAGIGTALIAGHPRRGCGHRPVREHPRRDAQPGRGRSTTGWASGWSPSTASTGCWSGRRRERSGTAPSGERGLVARALAVGSRSAPGTAPRPPIASWPSSRMPWASCGAADRGRPARTAARRAIGTRPPASRPGLHLAQDERESLCSSGRARGTALRPGRRSRRT